jgi:hypothetical protein
MSGSKFQDYICVRHRLTANELYRSSATAGPQRQAYSREGSPGQIILRWSTSSYEELDVRVSCQRPQILVADARRAARDLSGMRWRPVQSDDSRRPSFTNHLRATGAGSSKAESIKIGCKLTKKYSVPSTLRQAHKARNRRPSNSRPISFATGCC